MPLSSQRFWNKICALRFFDFTLKSFQGICWQLTLMSLQFCSFGVPNIQPLTAGGMAVWALQDPGRFPMAAGLADLTGRRRKPEEDFKQCIRGPPGVGTTRSTWIASKITYYYIIALSIQHYFLDIGFLTCKMSVIKTIHDYFYLSKLLQLIIKKLPCFCSLSELKLKSYHFY